MPCCPHIDALAGDVTAFAEMMTARTGRRDLEAWSPPWKPTTRPTCAPWQPASAPTCKQSSTASPCPGTPARSIKRQMYCQASFDLLRKRVILHPA